jgi:class 3 adenylate cyclase
MSLDDKATVAALDAARAVFRTQIEAQQGRIIDMPGDSVLAVFGTATGAVNAALAIQAQVNALAEAEMKTGACAFVSACTWATSSRRSMARCMAMA